MTLERWAHAASAPAAQALWRWMRWAGGVGPQHAAARRYHSFGDGALICFPPGDNLGEDHISIGERTLIAPNVTMSVGMVPDQPLQAGIESPVLRIGARCLIGRGTHLVAHCSLVVHDDVMTGPGCYVTDQNHVYSDPELPIGRQWPSDQPVEIGPGSWLGAHSVVLPGTSLGRNSVVAAGSVVRGRFPDHVVLAGAPAKVVRSYHESTGWQPDLRELAIEPPDGWPRR